MDEKKVILMSKLAIEEKTCLKKDKKITSYYPEDYIYMNNFRTRCLVVLLTGMGCIGHLFIRIQLGLTFPNTIQEIFADYIIPYGGTVLLIGWFYTILSTCVYRRRYVQANKRMNSYRKTLKELEEYEVGKIKGGNSICK